MSEEITLAEAREIVDSMESPAVWRSYSKRTEAERTAFGILILDRVMHGRSLRTIEQELGIPRATVARYRDLALSKVATPVVEEARKVELERIDALIDAIWDSAIAGDKDALNGYIKLSDKRAALLGLNKPIEVNQTVTEISKEEAELQAFLAQEERDNAMARERLLNEQSGS